jgi:hypothetical protein
MARCLNRGTGILPACPTRHYSMTKILYLITVLFSAVIPVFAQTKKAEFSMEIKGETCNFKVYRPKEPIIFTPLLEKNQIPKSQLLRAYMVENSDICSHLSDEEVSALIEKKVEPAMIDAHRASSKKRLALTSPTAEDNPWKGMKYVFDAAYLVESKRGTFLVHQTSTQGMKDSNGHIFGTLKLSSKKWLKLKYADTADEEWHLELLKEFSSKIKTLEIESPLTSSPLEDLMKQ